MIDLGNTVSKKYSRILQSIRRTLRHAAAFTLAAPIGFFQYFEEDQIGMIDFIEEEFSDDPRLRDQLLKDRVDFQRNRGGIRDYIKGWYDDLKPY